MAGVRKAQGEKLSPKEKKAAIKEVADAFRVPRGTRKLFHMEVVFEAQSRKDFDALSAAIVEAVCPGHSKAKHVCLRRWSCITWPLDKKEQAKWEPLEGPPVPKRTRTKSRKAPIKRQR